jgi:hypothetical protein
MKIFQGQSKNKNWNQDEFPGQGQDLNHTKVQRMGQDKRRLRTTLTAKSESGRFSLVGSASMSKLGSRSV